MTTDKLIELMADAIGQAEGAPEGDRAHDIATARAVIQSLSSSGYMVVEGCQADCGEAACEDCGRLYGSAGFPDLIIPNSAWREISPNGDETGLLCPSCLIARLHINGRTCEGAFMSGPVISVSRELMTTMRWVENLREQGHGWSCPNCGDYRDATSSEAGLKSEATRSDEGDPASNSASLTPPEKGNDDGQD
jgi:hypothetical protein